MGRASQRKGRRAELELVRVLQEHGYTDAAPGPPLNYGACPDITGISGVHVEVKNVARLNLPSALRQAAEDATYFQDGLPAVFHRHRGAGWVVSMSLEDWITLREGSAVKMTGECNSTK